MQSLIVFSHVRWDGMFQRPRHVLTRLARTWRVLFVEEPVFGAGDPRGELRAVQDGITVLTPHTPLTAPGFHDDQIPLLTKLLGRAIAHEQIADYGAWFCTPMALPLLHRLGPRVVVYDCVDELAARDNAPRQFVQRENALLRVANVVFCSGPSLFEARRERHSNVVLCADSVDREHFAVGSDAAATHADIRGLARPRLGFIGVIDERIDVALLDRVALARPEWEICVVGPVGKADATMLLPYAPNLHYFGARRYEEWPAFLAGWDVALLPFARSDATRALNPVQALEYMAADRPIVSTPIADVETLYRDVVRFGRADDAFIAAVEDTLVEPVPSRAQRIAAMRAIVNATSWDDTARRMRRSVEAAADHGLTDAARAMREPVHAPDARTRAMESVAACVILGGGATGLSAAYHYGAGSVVLEREARVGGGCRSIEDTGFTFDCAGHIMLSDDPYVQDLYRLLLGDNVHWQERDASVYRDGGHTRCPVHDSLQGLPPELLGEGLAALTLENEASVTCADVTTIGAQSRFGYPLRGGFQSLMDGFLPLLHGDVLLDADVERVSPQSRSVVLKDGRRFRYHTLISTMPLPALVAAVADDAPPDVRRAAGELRHLSIRCVNLGVARARVTDKHWIYFPDDTIFHRVFVQGNASPHCNPPGGFGLICEISYSRTKPLAVTGTALIDRCMHDCIAVGLLDTSDSLLTANEVDIFHAYVIHDEGRAERVAVIREWFARFDIVLAGRFGEWEHASADHAFIAGKKAAMAALRLGAVHAVPKRA